MRKFLAVLILMLATLSCFGQGVKVQWATTNTGPVVTNIVRILSSNLLPNRLSATNSIPAQLRVYAATNLATAGFWLDPTTLTPGAATNVIDVAAGTGIAIATNALLRTISTPALTNNDTRTVVLNGNFSGTFAGNGGSLTNISVPVSTMPQVLFNPPHVGPVTNTGNYFITGNNSRGVMLPGAGIIRELWIQTELGVAGNLNSNMANLRLEVFTDMGNTTNLAFRTIDVSMADIFGNRFRFPTNGQWAVDRFSFGMDTQDRSTNLHYGGYIKTVMFRLPIYFTNYCLIRITNSVTGQLWGNGYLSASREMTPDLASLGSFAAYRLRSSAFFGGLPTSVSNHLFSINGPGICAGWLQGVLATNVSNEQFLDSISPTFQSPAGITWQCPGGDDFFASTYAMKAGQSFGYSSGIINRWFGPQNDNGLFAIEGYRWFENDSIHWTNGVSVFIPDCEAIGATAITMFYYGP